MKVPARVNAVIDLVKTVLGSPTIPADRLVTSFLRNHRFIGSHDRREITDLAYGLFRQFPKVTWLSEKAYARAGNRARRPRVTEDTPLVGATTESHPYDELDARRLVLIYLVAERNLDPKEVAAVFTGERYAPKPLVREEQELIRFMLSTEDAPEWVNHAVPEWMWPHLQDTFGPRAAAEFAALNEEAPFDLRVNPLRTSRDEMLAQLRADGFEPTPTYYSPLGIRLKRRVVLPARGAYKDGFVEVQDEGSQIVSLLCDARPKMQVLDYCAGAGGKSLVLGAKMQNTGHLVLADTADWRLRRAKDRLRDAGVQNAECRPLHDQSFFARRRSLQTGFDRVLADVPCSGAGTWRRNPDMKLRFTERDFDEIVVKQQQILRDAAQFVKPGGMLLYATCSFVGTENEKQIEKFLRETDDFKLVPIRTLWSRTIPESDCPAPAHGAPFLQLTPARTQTDGFFAAALERKK